jgi:hypothetical protein
VSEELLRAIRDAFPAGTPPDRPLTGHRCDECDEADRLLGGRTWTDVADDFPHYCHDAFPLLTPAAQAYYLPAYLCHEMRSPGYMAGPSVQSALDGGTLPREWFTPAQRAAVLRWAEWFYRDLPGGHGHLLDDWQGGGVAPDSGGVG